MAQSDECWEAVSCEEKFPFYCFHSSLVLVKENKTGKEALEHCHRLDKELVSLTSESALTKSLQLEQLQRPMCGAACATFLTAGCGWMGPQRRTKPGARSRSHNVQPGATTVGPSFRRGNSWRAEIVLTNLTSCAMRTAHPKTRSSCAKTCGQLLCRYH